MTELALSTAQLVADLKALIATSRQRAAQAVNAELSMLYWQIGQRIRKEILDEARAAYGKKIIAGLARQLTQEFGAGWSKRQLDYCVRFAETFEEPQIVHTVCAQLSWSHIRQLIYIDDELKRQFYVEMCQLERWSVRQLADRTQSMLYERTAISKKPEITIRHDLEKLRQEQSVQPDLLLKDPYVLDFLGLQDHYLEKDLEDAILRELEQFLLELGAGFTFVARQKRVQIDDDDFYLDLLFYNRKLRRLVAIDLKLGNFKAEYKGQMELYLRWLAKYEAEPDEDPPLGIILCAGKKVQQIELLELDKSGIHVAEYLTVLPPRKELEERLRRSLLAAQQKWEVADGD